MGGLSTLTRLVLLIAQVATGVLIAFTITTYIVQGYSVSGSCMLPHVRSGERILVDKLSYIIRQPRRGDIIVFRYPPDPSQYYLKRIVGLPGDTISIRDNQVYINSRRLTETYIVQPSHEADLTEFVPHDRYYVMGDNRDYSEDSRIWGTVPDANIIGCAVICYWPLTKYHILQ